MSPTTLPPSEKLAQNRKLSNGLILFFLFILIVTFLAWGIRWATRGNTLGADFFIYYWAGRGTFIHGMDPYDPQLVSETQMGITGQQASPDQDQLAFAYPAFALFPVFMLVWFDFPTAQAIWMSLNLVLLILSAALLVPQSPPWMSISLALFYPIAFALVLGNYNISTGVVLMVFLCLYVLRRSPKISIQIVTGALLAWAVVKPQLTWLFLILAGLIILRDRLWALFISSMASFFALVTLSFVVFPANWPAQWLARTQAYTHYIRYESVISIFLKSILPSGTANILSIVLIALLSILTIGVFLKWWVQYVDVPHLPAPVLRFLTDHWSIRINNFQILAWIGFVIYFVHPFPKSYEQISLMIPFFLWAANNWKEQKMTTLIFWIAGLVSSWLALYADLMKWNPVAIYAVPALFFTIWVLFVFKSGLLPHWKRMPHAAA